MDDLAAAAAVNLLTAILKDALSEIGAAARRVGAQDPLGTAAREYRTRAYERYNNVKILGMTQPVPLTQLYTRVNVLERVTASRRDTVEELQEIVDPHQRRFGRIRATKSGLEAISEIERCVILGKPGSGKTTFLKHIALEALDGSFQPPRIPVLVTLRSLTEKDPTVWRLIENEFATSGLSDSKTAVRRLFEKGKCLLLLDGLDEVPDAIRADAIREIASLSDSYPECKYIITCRVAAYNRLFERYTDVEIADFSKREIEVFVQNWFVGRREMATACLSKIWQTDGLRELASTPLLLTLLCLAYDNSLDISTNRAELYKEAIDALLKRWDASRNIKRSEVYHQLTTKRKEDLFAFIAYENFRGERYFFRRNELERQIGSFLTHFPGVSKTDSRELASATLDAIEANHGLIVERSKDVYSFSHLTLQEYFVAQSLALSSRPEATRELAAHIDDVRWREVIILGAQLMPAADVLVSALLASLAVIANDSQIEFRVDTDGLPAPSSAPSPSIEDARRAISSRRLRVNSYLEYLRQVSPALVRALCHWASAGGTHRFDWRRILNARDAVIDPSHLASRLTRIESDLVHTASDIARLKKKHNEGCFVDLVLRLHAIQSDIPRPQIAWMSPDQVGRSLRAAAKCDAQMSEAERLGSVDVRWTALHEPRLGELDSSSSYIHVKETFIDDIVATCLNAMAYAYRSLDSDQEEAIRAAAEAVAVDARIRASSSGPHRFLIGAEVLLGVLSGPVFLSNSTRERALRALCGMEADG